MVGRGAREPAGSRESALPVSISKKVLEPSVSGAPHRDVYQILRIWCPHELEGASFNRAATLAVARTASLGTLDLGARTYWWLVFLAAVSIT